MERAFKIPSWHELHSDYFRFLENRKEVTKLVAHFYIQNNIKSEMFMTGEDEKSGKPFFLVMSKDPATLRRDKRVHGVAFNVPDKNGALPIRKNSILMQHWLEILRLHDNLKVLAEPKIISYVVFDGKDLGKFEREFLVDGKNLYLRVKSDKDFVVTDDFVEIELYKFYDMKEEKENG